MDANIIINNRTQDEPLLSKGSARVKKSLNWWTQPTESSLRIAQIGTSKRILKFKSFVIYEDIQIVPTLKYVGTYLMLPFRLIQGLEYVVINFLIHPIYSTITALTRGWDCSVHYLDFFLTGIEIFTKVPFPFELSMWKSNSLL